MLVALLLGLSASAADVRTVDGPWSNGAYITVAADSSGAVHAAWLDDEILRYATSTDAGTTWSAPETVADEVEAGDGGQIRPEVALTDKGPAIAYVTEQRPHLSVRGSTGWTDRALSTSTVGVGALVDLAVIGGKPVVAWLDTRRDPERHVSDVYAWLGAEEAVYVDSADGVCMCCRPAVGVVDGKAAVAFRDAAGAGREVRLLVRDGGTWIDRGQITHGGWAPGGCPADGPVFVGDQVLVSDARDGTRKLWRGDELVRATEGEAMHPRSVGDQLVWLNASPGKTRLMLDDRVLAERAGRLELLDPAQVRDELWIPYQGASAHVLAVTSG